MNAEQTQLKAQPSVHFLAIVSLVLSILGMMPVLPLVGSIAGIVTGVIARKEIRNRPGQYSGDGAAKAGIILGWVGIGLAIVAVVGLLLFLMPVATLRTGGGPSVIITPQLVTP